MQTLSLETLTKEDLIVYQELFSLFDKQDDGTISVFNLPLFVRGLGHCPTEMELKTMVAQLDPKNAGKVYFNSLVELLLKRNREQNIEDELLEAFEGIQSETGSVGDEKNYMMSVKEAKKFLTDFGEKFTEAETERFQEFLTENNLKEGNEFNYRDLVRIMAYTYF